LALTYGLLGDQQHAGHYAKQALSEAQHSNDEATMGKAYYVLSMEGYWSGQPQQGGEYGAKAVDLLEHTTERYWLGMAHFYRGLNAYLLGEFAPALTMLGHAQAIGDATGNPRLQSLAAWITGWIYATQGDWAAGIARCQQGLDCSPDPLNTAGALGYLGTAHLEHGDVSQAIPLLEQSIQQWQKFHFPQLQGWFTALLGEAYLLRGDIAQGHALAQQGLAITQEVRFAYGMGIAQRVLGKIQQARGQGAAAEACLTEALQTFTTTSAHFEVGRTHLALAELAHLQGNHQATTLHFNHAYTLFQHLRIPYYVEHTTTRATMLGVSLTPENS
jgi:tetratricopeptide (TPR) repeat protein